MRISEILGLQWQDVDFERAILHVRRSCVDGVIGECKTESSRRPLPLPEKAAEALKAWRDKSSYTKPESWVFASDAMFGRQPLYAGSLWLKNIAPAIARAGITKPKLRWHTLQTILRFPASHNRSRSADIDGADATRNISHDAGDLRPVDWRSEARGQR